MLLQISPSMCQSRDNQRHISNIYVHVHVEPGSCAIPVRSRTSLKNPKEQQKKYIYIRPAQPMKAIAMA